MAELALLYGADGLIEMDAVISETHEGSSEVTEHALERGVAITDHIQGKPRRLEIVGVVSNFPIVRATAETKQAETLIAEYAAALQRQERMAQIPVVGAFLRPDPPTLSLDIDNPNLGRTAAAWAELQRIRREAVLVRVGTTLEDYPSMAITDLRTTRTAREGESLEIAISLREVVIVSSELAEIPEKYLKPKTLGRQSTKPADAQTAAKATAAVRDRSFLHTVGGR